MASFETARHTDPRLAECALKPAEPLDAVINHAIFWQQQGQPQHARAHWELLLDAVPPDSVHAVHAHRGLGFVSDLACQREDALRHYGDGQRIVSAWPDSAPNRNALLGALWGDCGGVYHSTGRLSQAIAAYETQLSLSRHAGHPAGECAALGHLGISHFAQQQLDTSQDYHLQQLKLARATWKSGAGGGGGAGAAAEGRAENEAAENEAHGGVATEAEGTERNGEGANDGDGDDGAHGPGPTLPHLHQHPHPDEESRALCGLASIDFARNDLQQCQERLRLASMLAQQESNILHQAQVKAALGQAATACKQFRDAHAHLACAKLLAERAGNAATEAKVEGLLGSLQLAEPGNLATAIVTLGSALKKATDIGDTPGTARLSATLANALVASNSPANLLHARPLIQRAIDLSEAIGDRTGLARARGVELTLCLEQGDVARACEVLPVAVEMAEELGDGAGLARLRGIEAGMLLRQGEFHKAAVSAKEAQRLGEQLGDLRCCARASYRLAWACRQTKGAALDPPVAESEAATAVLTLCRQATEQIDAAATVEGALERTATSAVLSLPPELEEQVRLVHILEQMALVDEGRYSAGLFSAEMAHTRHWLSPRERATLTEETVLVAIRDAGLACAVAYTVVADPNPELFVWVVSPSAEGDGSMHVEFSRCNLPSVQQLDALVATCAADLREDVGTTTCTSNSVAFLTKVVVPRSVVAILQRAAASGGGVAKKPGVLFCPVGCLVKVDFARLPAQAVVGGSGAAVRRLGDVASVTVSPNGILKAVGGFELEQAGSGSVV